MDAEGLLRKQGWKGSGHSLDNGGRGIKKPLLISHKQDQLGLGKKKAAHTADDQWWMRAFDESLQNFGTGQKVCLFALLERAPGRKEIEKWISKLTFPQSTLAQIQEKGINRGGLYGFFVRGEGLTGTIGSEEESSASTSAAASGKSTPITSASEDETTTSKTATKGKKAEKADKKQKRKRDTEEETSSSKKSKKADKKGKKEKKDKKSKQEKSVSDELAKLSLEKKAGYEARAALKGQTLEEYMSRRKEKKEIKKASK